MTLSPPDTIDAGPVILRRERRSDAAAIALLIGTNLERLAEFMPWAVPETATEAVQHDRITLSAVKWEARDEFDYVITADDVILGKIGLPRRIGSDAIELGYWIGEIGVGRGNVSAAAVALTRHALLIDGIDRVEIHCDRDNHRSAAVARRAGFTLDRIEDDEVRTSSQSGYRMVWTARAVDRPVTTPESSTTTAPE